MNDWLWTRGGHSFGWRDGDSLFTYQGIEAGRFHGDEIYGADGAYLGELKNGRLIARLSKQTKRRSPFLARSSSGRMDQIDRPGMVIHDGFEDFPSPEDFR